MKISQLTLPVVLAYARIHSDDAGLVQSVLMPAAVAYVLSYTGLTATEADDNETLTIAVLALVSDLYDNRQLTAESAASTNRTVQTILDMYSKNLL